MNTGENARWLLPLVGWVALCFGAAAVGSVFTARSVGTWYVELAKPSWTPPSWVFGPAWTLLYLMMAVSAWIVWRSGPPSAVAGPLGLFLSQLAVNVAWSVLFFGLRSPLLGLIDIGVLWLLIVATMIAFFRVSAVAGGLLVPYLAWVSFASALNFAIWRLNT
jgi:translocator protein